MRLVRLWQLAILACTLMSNSYAGEILKPANNSILAIGENNSTAFPFTYDSGLKVPELISQEIDIIIGTSEEPDSGIVYLGTQQPIDSVYHRINLSLMSEFAQVYNKSVKYYLIALEKLKDINYPDKPIYQTKSISIRLAYSNKV